MNSKVPNTHFTHMHTHSVLHRESILIRHRMALTYQSQAQLRVTNQELGSAQSSVSLISFD